jgi:biotin carboxyl carrier protein
LEAMKMEVAFAAPKSFVIEELRCAPGGIVNAGQNLMVFRAEAGA